MAEDFRLTQIEQIAVKVNDVKRAVLFYRHTLGMKLLFEIPNTAFFDCGSVRLMLACLTTRVRPSCLDHLLQGSEHPGHLRDALLPRRTVRGRTAFYRPHIRPRSVDGVLPGPGG